MNLCTVLHSGYISVHSHQQCKFQHLLFVDFFDDGHSTSVRRCLIVVLICIFLIINDTEHLFKCFITFCMSSLEKCLFRSSARFFIVDWFYIHTYIHTYIYIYIYIYVELHELVVRVFFSFCL